VSLGDYLLGAIGLAAVAASLGLAAVRLRARLLPGWDGAPARLAEAVLGISLFTVILQLLGAAGILGPITLVVASIAVGVGIAVWVAASGEEGEPPPSPAVPRLHLVLALLAAVFLATHWATGLQDVWGRGIFTFDSVWYHGPFAARIADTGNAWPLHFTDPLYLNWFYPENSELQHSAGMALFGHDLFSPLINFAWLGLALLAAWCIGRPHGVAPLSLVAVILILDTGPMVPREAGTMANDIAPIALLLAAAAVMINAEAGCRFEPRTVGGQALVVAGLAAGLALGTKMTIAGGVAALAVGVLYIARPERRRRALLLFVGGVAITAGFWFLRNLIHTGNPLPWVNDIGPIELPGPGRGLEGREPFSVSHYIFANPSTDVWRSFFFEGTQNLLGPGWFLLLGGAAAGALVSLIRPVTRTVRVLGAVVVVATLAYLLTPLTAAGPDGQPTAFTINFRYWIAALALGLALLPLILPSGDRRVRLPGFSGGLPAGRLQPPLLVGGLALLVITSQYSDSAAIWDDPFTSIPAAILIGVVLVGAPVGLALLGRRSASLAAAAGAALAVAIVSIGYERQDNYLDSRYAGSDGFQYQIDDAARWANPLDHERIAVAGTSGAYNQYAFYGTDLDNYVQFVGRQEPGGDFRAITKCAPWRQAVNDGDYDYVVTTPELDLNAPATTGISPERGWLLTDPHATEILHTGRVSVFRLTGELDPGTCGQRVDRLGVGPPQISTQ
jgi:hypothetical protein